MWCLTAASSSRECHATWSAELRAACLRILRFASSAHGRAAAEHAIGATHAAGLVFVSVDRTQRKVEAKHAVGAEFEGAGDQILGELVDGALKISARRIFG